MSMSALPHPAKELNRVHASGRYAQLIQAQRENLAQMLREHSRDDSRVLEEIEYLALWLYENQEFAAAEEELKRGMIIDTAGRDDLKERNVCFLLALVNI